MQCVPGRIKENLVHRGLGRCRSSSTSLAGYEGGHERMAGAQRVLSAGCKWAMRGGSGDGLAVATVVVTTVSLVQKAWTSSVAAPVIFFDRQQS